MGVLVDGLRAIGLDMGTVYAPYTSSPDDEGNVITTRRYRSWTRDEAKAAEARELEATVVEYLSSDPGFSGWEISVNEVEDE